MDAKTSLPHFVAAPSHGWNVVRWREMWEYRELLFFLVWRSVKLRYQQTLLGVLWVVLQPLALTLLLTVVFGRLASPTEKIPYSLVVLSALLPWQWFAQALSAAGQSLVLEKQLITKIYFPRLFVPLSAVLVGVLDFAIGLVLLGMMVLYYGVDFRLTWLTLPIWFFLTFVVTSAVGIWLAALNVRYRDVQYTIPFLTQFWFLATPIAYPLSSVPERWRFLYGLNPLVTVVEGFRWMIQGGTLAWTASSWVSLVIVMFLLFTGLAYFQRTERTFADVV